MRGRLWDEQIRGLEQFVGEKNSHVISSFVRSGKQTDCERGRRQSMQRVTRLKWGNYE